MSKSKLTEKQAYLAMYTFLDEYYQLTHSDDIGSLLGGMSLLEGGCTADPAIQSDWERAIRKVMENKFHAELELKK